eukprot:157682_1
MMFKQLSKIDNKTKYSVYGWIREAEHMHNFQHIPMMISNICVLYYREDEIFNTSSKAVKISDDKKSVTKIPRLIIFDNWSNNSYGIIEIPSNSSIKCQWDLKIIQSNIDPNENGFVVGISSIEVPDQDFEAQNGSHYGYLHDGKIFDTSVKESRGINWKQYGTFEGTIDTISIHLNMLKAEIKFVVNDIDQGIAYENIERSKDIKYKLFVSIFEADSIEIVNFTKQ